MPDKEEGDDKKSTKDVVNKKQKQMMGEEGYDVARDMGRVKPSKDKKDATSYPVSDEVKKTQKVNKGPSALERVKKKYKGQIMDVKKEELDLTQVAEAFGGYIVEAPVDSEGNIKPKPGEAGKTRKKISKIEKEITGKNIDVDSEKKILDAQQDPDLKKLDKINKAQDNAIKSLSKQGVDLTAKPGKTTKPKGFKTTKSGNVTTQVGGIPWLYPDP